MRRICVVDGDIEREAHCPRHPRYLAQRKPAGGCVLCWCLWSVVEMAAKVPETKVKRARVTEH